jgi:acyl carrier protein
MNTPLYKQAKTLVCDTLEIPTDELSDDTHFVDDLGIDSILIIELKTRFEEEYQISIDKEILKELNCLADIMSYLDRTNVQAL